MTSTQQSTTDSRPDREDSQYQEPPAEAYPAPDRPVLVSEALIRSTIDSLQRIEDFLRHHTNPTVRGDLRAHAEGQGWHPAAGPEAFLDGIALGAYGLSLVLTDREETGTTMT